MGQITGGVIKYGRTIKTGDYENKRADVEISFSVGEGEDYEPAVKTASLAAHTHLHRLLGLKAAPGSAGTGSAGTGVAEPQVALASPPMPALNLPPRTKADLAAEKMGKNVASAAKPAVVKPPKVAAVNATGRTIDPADPVGDEDFSALPEITDAQLRDAATKKNAVLKNGPAIRGLVAEYVSPPKGLCDIPQPARQPFLDKLANL